MASMVRLVLWYALVVFSFVGAQRSSSRTARPTTDAAESMGWQRTSANGKKWDWAITWTTPTLCLWA